MSQGRKKNMARPGLEPRTSRIPCEHSSQLSYRATRSTCDNFPLLRFVPESARNRAGTDETVPLLTFHLFVLLRYMNFLSVDWRNRISWGLVGVCPRSVPWWRRLLKIFSVSSCFLISGGSLSWLFGGLLYCCMSPNPVSCWRESTFLFPLQALSFAEPSPWKVHSDNI